MVEEPCEGADALLGGSGAAERRLRCRCLEEAVGERGEKRQEDLVGLGGLLLGGCQGVEDPAGDGPGHAAALPQGGVHQEVPEERRCPLSEHRLRSRQELRNVAQRRPRVHSRGALRLGERLPDLLVDSAVLQEHQHRSLRERGGRGGREERQNLIEGPCQGLRNSLALVLVSCAVPEKQRRGPAGLEGRGSSLLIAPGGHNGHESGVQALGGGLRGVARVEHRCTKGPDRLLERLVAHSAALPLTHEVHERIEAAALAQVNPVAVVLVKQRNELRGRRQRRRRRQ